MKVKVKKRELEKVLILNGIKFDYLDAANEVILEGDPLEEVKEHDLGERVKECSGFCDRCNSECSPKQKQEQVELPEEIEMGNWTVNGLVSNQNQIIRYLRNGKNT